MRANDGSAGDVDYACTAVGYARFRRPEPRIAAFISGALGPARMVLNVGAGTGSYEPRDRSVTAVEPSATMRAGRPPGLADAIDAVAEALPFEDCWFEASMSTFSVHQWADAARGLREMRRVTRGPVVILTCDPALVQDFWLADYVPEVLAAEARRYPRIESIASVLEGEMEVVNVPIPLDCCDGFNEAYFGRPEMFLETGARASCSAWSFVPQSSIARGVSSLAHDLSSGEWDRRYGALRRQQHFFGSLRLLVGQPAA